MSKDIIRKYFTRIILLGDVLFFWLALKFTLILRYGFPNLTVKFSEHFYPFIFIMFVWLVVFYVVDLYTFASLHNTIRNKKKFLTGIVVSSAISLSFFYIFQNFFKITPKTNFFLFIIFFSILDYLWRYVSVYIISKKTKENILLLSSSPLNTVIIEHIKNNLEHGYKILEYNKRNSISAFIKENNCKGIVVDSAFLSDEKTIKELYQLVSQNIEVISLTDFYESIFSRVPLSELNEKWFIKQIKLNTGIYNKIKSLVDIILAVGLIVVLSPILIIVAILVKISSEGPILYRQIRVGIDGKNFTLLKFRTMCDNPEKNKDAHGNSPTWCETDDKRITRIGKILRETHLDEMPQLFNILKEELSFVGPRPERPEFFEKLNLEIPHYLFRQTIKPGLTGWAQIKFRYARTMIDSREKFEYDLFYIKTRNIFLDVKILLKTIQFVFIH